MYQSAPDRSSSPRRAVVTGAASGIGRASALRLLGGGTRVLAVDVSEAGLAPVVAAGADPLVADLGTEAGCDAVVAAGAGADAVVNAAGIIRLRPILELTRADWRDIFRINAESIFFLCQGLGPTMPEGGAIVNLSSSSAKLAATIETAIYAASKTAILSITRSFAHAFADRGVRVNAVCPGIIDTPMQDAVLADVARARATTPEQLATARNATVPLGRPASPDELAGLIHFLLTDDAAYMTGQAINFTGGLVTW